MQQIVTILLNPELKEQKICKEQPTDVEHNVAFIVDLTKLKHVRDVHCDDMGSWTCNGVYRSWVDVDDTGFVTSHGKSKPKVPEANTFYVTKKYFVHKTSKDLKKSIVFIAGNDW